MGEGPVFGQRPDRADVEALLHRRINTALRRLRDGEDWRDRFTIRPILRRATSMQNRPYRVRQWGVWLDGEPELIGYVTTDYGGTRLRFLPYPLPAGGYEIDTCDSAADEDPSRP